jgi:hypothetical protein
MNALGNDCSEVKTLAGVARTKIRRFSIMPSLLFADIKLDLVYEYILSRLECN